MKGVKRYAVAELGGGAWETHPLISGLTKGPRDKNVFLRSRHSTLAPLSQGPDNLGPLLSHLLLCLFLCEIAQNILKNNERRQTSLWSLVEYRTVEPG